MAAKLTDLKVRNAKPKLDESGVLVRAEYTDGSRPLRLVLQPSGARSWAVRYRFKGQTRKLTLKGFPSLAEARRQADDAMALLKGGVDPATAKKDAAKLAAQADAERKKDTLEQLLARFTEQHVKKNLRPATQKQAAHVFNDIVLPAWQGRIIHDIKRRDVITLLDDVAAERGGVTANRTLSYLSRFFRWCCAKDILASAPHVGVERPAQETARDRVLSDSEIRQYWQATDALDDVGSAFAKLLLLLGQRRGEIAGMRRSEIEGDLWTIPATRMKGKLPHCVPLPKMAVAIIGAVPTIDGSDLIFSRDGRRPFAIFSKAKKKIDAAMQPATPFVWHDTRRTFRTLCSRAKVAGEISERCVAHLPSGVAKTYNRYEFVAEKRQAFEAVAALIDRIVRGEPAGVTDLATEKAKRRRVR
jgi:integrase